MLGVRDLLPRLPQRAVVAGPAGADAAFAGRLAQALDVPYVEREDLAGWPVSAEDVRRLAAFDGWVTEWPEPAARPLLIGRADLLVWLDLPIARVLGQVVRRTALLRARREVRSALTDRRELDHQVPAAASSYPELTVVRLTRDADLDGWLGRLPA